MSDKEGLVKKPVKRWPRHGLTSWVDSRRMPQGRAFQKVRRELGRLRDQLIEENGGERATAAQRILIDATIEGMGVTKLIGLYIRKAGVVDAYEAGRGRLELAPALGRNWLAYQNSIRQNLLALKELDDRKEDPGPTPIEILAEAVRDEEVPRPAPEDDQADDPQAPDAGPEGSVE